MHSDKSESAGVKRDTQLIIQSTTNNRYIFMKPKNLSGSLYVRGMVGCGSMGHCEWKTENRRMNQ